MISRISRSQAILLALRTSWGSWNKHRMYPAPPPVRTWISLARLLSLLVLELVWVEPMLCSSLSLELLSLSTTSLTHTPLLRRSRSSEARLLPPRHLLKTERLL
ncbi:hypothetical protein EMPG_14607 [Blastomyces silverae]|uniref:Uncharacterized protein n=1 Tax=Blastomyces silverae TaxID=2060906 RepID=A0A0H1BLD3_9EURO|nr:hypothetical protein EMPG_14607 [Blastomyces silverae]